MINFLPRRYEDELLYSVIARYKEMSGFNSKKTFAKALFNSETYRISTLLTQNIQALVNNLPKNSLLTAEKLIKENTLYPFYTAFINQEKRDIIYSAMLYQDNVGIESHIGIKNWQCNARPTLKYCPLCYKEDIETYGESYWRRLFQIPGVLICPKHFVGLNESNIWANNLQLDFYCADKEICSTDYKKYSNKIIQPNTVYISNCIKLLNQPYASRDVLFFRDYYIDKLREKQLASKNGTIYMMELLEAFYNFYSQEYLQLLGSDFEIEDKSNWLRVFVRTTEKNRSPVRHLLLLQFLNKEVDDIFTCSDTKGKVVVIKKHKPILNREEKRNQWLKLLEGNPHASRSKLKEKSGGLHSWIFRHDREWYESVTPRYKVKPKRNDNQQYEMMDQQALLVVKKVVGQLLKTDEKPVRITYTAIKRHSGLNLQLKNGKYPLTYAYINSVTEEIEKFRIRKIKWAIRELYREEIIPTAYKVQLKAGFGGKNDKEIRQLINSELEKGDENV